MHTERILKGDTHVTCTTAFAVIGANRGTYASAVIRSIAMQAFKHSDGVLEPLLPKPDGTQCPAARPVQRDTFWACAFNLAKAVTGAGMISIPHAYLQIGSLLGTAMLLGVALITYFTLAVLVHGSAKTGATTYSQLVQATCGRGVMMLLQLSVLMFCFGFSVVYLVVIRDILLGHPPACSGLLCELFGLYPTGLLADPHMVIAAVALVICAPLLLLKSMDSLAFLNVMGVAAVALLAAVAAGLGIQALIQGTAYPIPTFPQWSLLGPTKPLQLEALADVLPVILACYVAHQSLHPLMPLLKPYSEARMCGVVAVGLAIAAGVFTMLSVGAALAFGPLVEENVLNNFSEFELEPLVGSGLAKTLSWVIRGGYLLSVLGSLLLYMHPLRSCLAEIFWSDGSASEKRGAGYSAAASAVADGGENSNHASSIDADVTVAAVAEGAAEMGCSSSEVAAGEVCGIACAGDEDWQCAGSAIASQQKQLPRWQRIEQRWYYTLTYGLLLAMVVVAILVPSIWSALSAIGDLASTTQAFMVPGVIALVLALKYCPTTGLGNGCKAQPDDCLDNAASNCGSSSCVGNSATTVQVQARYKHVRGKASLDSWLQEGEHEQPLLLMSPLQQHPVLQRLPCPVQQCVAGMGCRHAAVAARVVYIVLGSFVVVLGLALFVNGVYQRV